MHVNHNVDEFKPPFIESSLGTVGEDSELTPAHISALSVCLTSIDGIFESFLKLDVETIRCLPVSHFVRVTYAVVVLIKMYLAAANSNSEFGKVINKDNMKVEYYLDGLVDIFRAAAAEDRSRTAARFMMLLTMLKTWFQRHEDGKSSTFGEVPSTNNSKFQSLSAGDTASETLRDNSQNNSRQIGQHGQRPDYGPANTPLQLLSEVATKNQGIQSHPENTNKFQSTSNDWQQQQQEFSNYEPSLNHMAPGITPGYGNFPPAGNIDPSLGMSLGIDFGYGMGDGFEQAMGMTLGVGDFGNYFSEDSFFGNMMDSVGAGQVQQGFEGPN
jgi:hypothetical protein